MTYYGLRSYKGNGIDFGDGFVGQLGHEPDPDMFITHLCNIFDQVKRVLKPTGTLWVNIGDSYAGSGKGIGSDHGKAVISDEDIVEGRCPSVPSKSLIGIPERFVLEMLKHGWIRRNTVIWLKPSCMPSSAKDRFTVDFDYLYLFSQQQDYYFERQFEPMTFNRWSMSNKLGSSNRDIKTGQGAPGQTPHLWERKGHSGYYAGDGTPLFNPLGRNRRCVWSITSEGFKGAHYATFPVKLCETPILAGCPEYICTRCGKPRVKLYETKPMVTKPTPSGHGETNMTGTMVSPPEIVEIGLSDCGCGAPFVPGVVLDPFAGTGTVAVAARKLGRKAVLLEQSEEYCRMAQKRIEKIPLPMEW